MLSRIHNFFIPHEGNNHQPHSLRPKALKWYAGVLVGIKVITTLLLFVMFPNPALLSSEMKQEVLYLINTSRKQAGLSTLSVNPELERAAQAKAVDMLNGEYFSHITPSGMQPWDFIKTDKYRYIMAGENLAIDFVTPSSAHSALMASQTHKDNILYKDFTDVGIGIVTGTFQGRKTNILVQFFGAKKSAPKLVKTVQAAETTPTPAPTPAKTPQTEPEVKQEQKQEKPVVAEINKPETTETPVEESPIIEEVSVISPEIAIKDTLREIIAGKKEVREIQTGTVSPLQKPIEQKEELTVAATKKRATKLDVLMTLSMWSQRVLFVAMIYLTLALILKIFVRIRVQHLPVIRQTAMLIVVLAILTVTNWHIVETLTTSVKIL